MQDIRQFSDQELSLLVINDEGLYTMRHKPGFIDLLDELFIYTDEQKAELIQDLEDDKE